jgi:hypothetical protein
VAAFAPTASRGVGVAAYRSVAPLIEVTPGPQRARGRRSRSRRDCTSGGRAVPSRR